jgi:aspartate/methionine/tyrosine aminotransferase
MKKCTRILIKMYTCFQAVANFMGRVRGGRVRFDPDRIVMSGGATGANELITFCLADPGDVFLGPSPYYPAYGHSIFYALISFSLFSKKKQRFYSQTTDDTFPITFRSMIMFSFQPK